jgi:hypothetical protein
MQVSASADRLRPLTAELLKLGAGPAQRPSLEDDEDDQDCRQQSEHTNRDDASPCRSRFHASSLVSAGDLHGSPLEANRTVAKLQRDGDQILSRFPVNVRQPPVSDDAGPSRA